MLNLIQNMEKFYFSKEIKNVPYKVVKILVSIKN